jgi:hypothetical protein
MAQDDARDDARANEGNGPVSVNAPGRDLLAELVAAVESDPRWSADAVARLPLYGG